MGDMIGIGSPIWLAVIGVMLIITIVLFVVRGRRVFGREGSQRFDVTQIPPDLPGALEFIVRDDETGSSLQFVVLEQHARIVRVDVPRRHEGRGVEGELLQVAAASVVSPVETWTWPPLDVAAAATVRDYARSRPDLVIYDSAGNRY